MNLLPASSITASALQAQKIRLEVAAQNIANAHTTRGPDGLPYQRKIVSFAAELQKHQAGHGLAPQAVKVSSIFEDHRPGAMIYQPGHPDADPQGMVRMPNVQMALEMVDLMSAARAYEANLTVARSARELATRTLEIGR